MEIYKLASGNFVISNEAKLIIEKIINKIKGSLSKYNLNAENHFLCNASKFFNTEKYVPTRNSLYTETFSSPDSEVEIVSQFFVDITDGPSTAISKTFTEHESPLFSPIVMINVNLLFNSNDYDQFMKSKDKYAAFDKLFLGQNNLRTVLEHEIIHAYRKMLGYMIASPNIYVQPRDNYKKYVSQKAEREEMLSVIYNEILQFVNDGNKNIKEDVYKLIRNMLIGFKRYFKTKTIYFKQRIFGLLNKIEDGIPENDNEKHDRYQQVYSDIVSILR